MFPILPLAHWHFSRYPRAYSLQQLRGEFEALRVSLSTCASEDPKAWAGWDSCFVCLGNLPWAVSRAPASGHRLGLVGSPSAQNWAHKAAWGPAHTGTKVSLTPELQRHLGTTLVKHFPKHVTQVLIFSTVNRFYPKSLSKSRKLVKQWIQNILRFFSQNLTSKKVVSPILLLTAS